LEVLSLFIIANSEDPSTASKDDVKRFLIGEGSVLRNCAAIQAQKGVCCNDLYAVPQPGKKKGAVYAGKCLRSNLLCAVQGEAFQAL